MKKLITLIFLAVTLSLTADNYLDSFNATLREGNQQLADSILQVWARATPDDPDLFAARFNLLFNRAHSEIMVLSSDSSQTDEELILTDSTGNPAGYMYSKEIWDDSLVNRAFEEIDRGIASSPNRIDFRLGKAAAATIASRWKVAVDAIDGLLEQDARNGGKWFNKGNVVQTNADTIIAEAVFERLGDIYNTESRAAVEYALPLADKAAERFSNDVRILNMAGGLNFGVGNNDAALKYFEKAARVAPDDAIPLTNIAYIHYQQGDTAKALEIYRRIEKGNYDEESRNFAKQAISEITAPVKDMEEYSYFFNYLPRIAAQAESPTDFLDVELINSRIPSYNKQRSPFTDSDIKAEEISLPEKDAKIVVWTFPMPKKMPLCRYVAFVPDGKGKCKTLTLEKSLGDVWIVGTITDTGHTNFGEIPYPDNASAFVKALRKKNLLK